MGAGVRSPLARCIGCYNNCQKTVSIEFLFEILSQIKTAPDFKIVSGFAKYDYKL